MDVCIGVLALQGDVREHLEAVRKAGAQAVPVKTREEIDQVDGLIIPGGESTTVGKLLDRFGLMDQVRQLPEDHKPVFGTCTGMILLSKEIEGSQQPRIGIMDIAIRRNAFGRQIDSFEEDLSVKGVEGGPVRAVFIRAPLIEAVAGDAAVLVTLNDGRIVAAQQNHWLATSFHPELTRDTRFHQYFLAMIRK
jgi:5'-phosphate synthase pdxT subunit